MNTHAYIRVEDAASQFRQRIGPNPRAWEKLMIENNNDLVDTWERGMLSKVANTEGSVRAEEVAHMFKVFWEGYGLCQLFEDGSVSHVALPSDEDVIYWRTFFENNETFEKLHKQGRLRVMMGWRVIVQYIQGWLSKQKMEQIFFDTDYKEWLHRAQLHKNLWDSSALPPLLAEPHVVQGSSNMRRGWIADDMHSWNAMVNTITTLIPTPR